MSLTEEQNKSLFLEEPSPILSIVLKPKNKCNFVSSNFTCNFLYACEVCDGPLVPVALCTVCKRASVRKCLHCQRDIIIGTHSSCSALTFFYRVFMLTRSLRG